MSSKTLPHQNTNGAILGIYGAGGFAREVMPFALDSLSEISRNHLESTKQIYFVETDPKAKEINGVPLISEEEFFELKCRERLFNIAISDSKIREKLAIKCIRNGATPLSLQASNSTIYQNNDIGDGSIMCAYTMVTSNAKIGRFFHSNIYSYVAHDCVIGDFVTFAPRVHCNGNVHVHNHAYIGTNAVIKQGEPGKPLIIGEGSVVGMGAIVTKDVLPYTTVVGNPATLYSKGY